MNICALLLWDLWDWHILFWQFSGAIGRAGPFLCSWDLEGIFRSCWLLPALLPDCLRCFLFLSYQNVDGWWLRHSRQQRCPAKPAVLLATSHGGDPQSHRGECPRWAVVSDNQKCLVVSGGNNPWLKHAPATEPVELAIDTLQSGPKSW